MTAAAVTGQRTEGGIAACLHGRREARRRGIDGRAARTVSSTWSGRVQWVGLEPVGDALVEERVGRSGHAGRSSGRRRSALVRVEHDPQLADRVVQAGPRRPDGDPEGCRDLGQGIARDGDGGRPRPVVRASACGRRARGRPVPRRSAPTSGDTGGSVWRIRMRAAQRRSPAGLRVAGVDDDPVEPRIEPLRVAEAWPGRARRRAGPAGSRPGPDRGRAGSGRRARSSDRRWMPPVTRRRPGHPGWPARRARPSSHAPEVAARLAASLSMEPAVANTFSRRWIRAAAANSRRGLWRDGRGGNVSGAAT